MPTDGSDIMIIVTAVKENKSQPNIVRAALEAICALARVSEVHAKTTLKNRRILEEVSSDNQ